MGISAWLDRIFPPQPETIIGLPPASVELAVTVRHEFCRFELWNVDRRPAGSEKRGVVRWHDSCSRFQ